MDKKSISNKSPKKHRITRVILRIFVLLFALLLSIIIALNVPAVQTYITKKLIDSIREKTGTELTLGSVKIVFPKVIEVENVFVADQKSDTLLYLSSLKIDVKLWGLFQNKVDINNLELENAVANIRRENKDSSFNFQFIMDALSSKAPDTTIETSLPWIMNLNRISLKNVRGVLNDTKSGTDLSFNINEFESNVKDFDFSKREYHFKNLTLKNSSIQVALSKARISSKPKNQNSSSTVVTKENIASLDTAGMFSGLKFSTDSILMVNVNIRYDDNEFEKVNSGFDFKHISVTHLNSLVVNTSVSNSGLLTEINNLSLEESSGVDIKKFSGITKLTPNTVEFAKLNLETDRSKISADAKMIFSSLNSLSSDLGNCNLELDLKQSVLNPSEIELFLPSLSTAPIFEELKKSNIAAAFKANGKVNNLEIENLSISGFENSKFVSHGHINGLPNMDKINFNVKIDLLATTLSDINKLVDPKLLNGINLPPTMNLSGELDGSLQALNANLNFNSTYGNVLLNGFYKKLANGRDTVELKFAGNKINVGKLIGDSAFGNINISGVTSTSKRDNEPIVSNGKVQIEDLFYNSYNYSNIDVQYVIDGDSVITKVISDDENIKFNLLAKGYIRNQEKKYSTELELSSLNLKELNFSEKDFNISTTLKADFIYNGLNNAIGQLQLDETDISNEVKRVLVKKFNVDATSSLTGVDVSIESDLLDGKISGNILAADLGKTFSLEFKQYFHLNDTEVVKPGKNIEFNLNVHLPEDVIEIVSPDLKGLEITKFDGNYNSDNNSLELDLKIPHVLYAGVLLDSMNVSANGVNDKLVLDVSCKKVTYSNFSIDKLFIKEQTDNGKIHSEISTLDSSDKINYLLNNEFEIGNNKFMMRFLSDGLVLAGEKWNADQNNLFVIDFGNSKTDFKKYTVDHFVFSKDEHSFGIQMENGGHQLQFKYFELQSLLDIISYKRPDHQFERGGRLVKGSLNGIVKIPTASSGNGLDVDITLNELYLLDTLVGDLSLKANLEQSRLIIDAGLTSMQNNFIVKGSVNNFNKVPEFDLSAKIDLKNLHSLEHFAVDDISELSGEVFGELKISGSTKSPVIIGDVQFDQTAFKVNSLNFFAKIQHDNIHIDQKGIHFQKFIIRDINDKELKIDGSVLTSNYSDYSLDLNLSAKDFQPINSSVKDNKSIYGKLSMAADIDIKGNSNSPIINAKIEIDSITDLTYALPGSELKLVSSEGVVQFLDSLQLLDTSQTVLVGDFMTDSILSKIKGLNLTTHLEIDQGAKFTIDVDPSSGDYLTVNGKAKLDITSDGTTGNQTMNGIYEVNSGFYQLSFYDLVKKDFLIMPGSTIVWSGSPMDADLNITAEYVVRTSSVALVANETSSMSEEEKKIFNKRLPFEVKLNIRGFLARPEISFNIGLPQQYLSDNPLVEVKLRQLNSENNEALLNKQVFALLVAGSFMAENPASASGGSSSSLASTAARNSVNGILANQLNNISNKYITGVDVNFGLTSYDDYSSSSGDSRTEMEVQVSKRLFNDRITVEAENTYGLKGSKNQNSPTASAQGYGQFAVIYRLTESGEYKLRAYYQNSYDSFDGDITYSGIALIFEKEFDGIKHVVPPLNEKPEEIKK